MRSSLLLLLLSFILSWPRFKVIFCAETGAAWAAASATTLAGAVSLGAIGLAVAQHGPWAGALFVVGTVCSTRVMEAVPPWASISLSVICLAAYIEMAAKVA